MLKPKSRIASLILFTALCGTLALAGCTANSITGAEMESPSAVQTESSASSGQTALPVSAAETSNDYNGADVNHESNEFEDETSNGEDEPMLSTDPRARYND